MPYQPLRSLTDVEVRLVVDSTREDHWLDFKRDPYETTLHDRVECARDVAQFANASGGNVVIGAEETRHILTAFINLQKPQELIRWIDDVVKGHLSPVPAIEPVALTTPEGFSIVAINVPPAPHLIARRDGDRYEFPIRAGDSKRYMSLMEVEARMQQHERLMRLRLERISNNDPVALDAEIHGIDHREWRIGSVDDDTVMLTKDGLTAVIPLSYIEAVYQAREPKGEWVIGLSCTMQKISGESPHLRVRKYRPQ